ncbi:MAG TPA: tetraacyldisaccharide 4'-kinase [Candidatus Angelobacter sp.]|nr:tetraacyldisaccharide 4'-kinase [Candidatus Angelobacter sp.]
MKTLSTLFGSGVAIRNALYDGRIFKVHRLSRPVASIGNISVGGSGKTPFVIALGELLKQRGIEFDVLSRGYRRRSQEIAVVDPQGSPEQFGDEPLLIARKLGVPVVVGADRYKAGLFAEEKFSSRLHLLDDGFQHRRLHRDFDIVMLPPSDLHDILLPLGRLREPRSALQRADAVVISSDMNQQDVELARKCMKPGASLWSARRVLEVYQGITSAVAFCGVARPKQFFEQLRAMNVAIPATVAFADHHRYLQSDIDRLMEAQAASGAAGFITTEKDEINLGSLAGALRPLQVARLRLALDSVAVAGTLIKTLEQRCGCGF